MTEVSLLEVVQTSDKDTVAVVKVAAFKRSVSKAKLSYMVRTASFNVNNKGYKVDGFQRTATAKRDGKKGKGLIRANIDIDLQEDLSGVAVHYGVSIRISYVVLVCSL